jgi:hypothetical protein
VAGVGEFSLLQNVWAGSKTHALSKSMGNTGFFPRDKAAKL